MNTLLAAALIVQAVVLIGLLLWIVRLIRQRDDTLRESIRCVKALEAKLKPVIDECERQATQRELEYQFSKMPRMPLRY
jgi:uncharacterized protein YoxC